MDAAKRPKDAPKQSARYQSDFKGLPEDVLEYAVYLGMDPKEDADLLWIASEALTAAEPEGWAEQMDPNGNVYYFNETTGQSSRQHPLDEYYQNLYLKLKLQRAMEVAGMEVPDTLKGATCRTDHRGPDADAAQLAANGGGVGAAAVVAGGGRGGNDVDIASADDDDAALDEGNVREVRHLAARHGCARAADQPGEVGREALHRDRDRQGHVDAVLPRYHMYMNLSDTTGRSRSPHRSVLSLTTRISRSRSTTLSRPTRPTLLRQARCN